MLHYETIDTPTLELLKELMQIPALENLRLVGGTGLALQKGHRKSVDIDLFGEIEADDIEVMNSLRIFNDLKTIHHTKNIKVFSINNIKTDIVNYPYLWLFPEIETDGIKLADIRDVAAMKVAAITNRGTKKDFIDLYFLLKDFTLDEIVKLYVTKYKDGSAFMALRSLVYFSDAETDLMPEMLMPADWEIVKSHIKAAVDAYQMNK
ncbi:Nucleotidyl transferase AbiEii toxin, Type IV TA system [anaerobic digester metagenome]